MKSFQIFSEPTPPREPYFGWMQKIRDMSEAYTLIAPSNFMDADWVDIKDVFNSLPQHMQENFNGRYLYDAIRVRYLTQHFDHVYFDVDIELFKTVEQQYIPQRSGPGIMAGNGNPGLGLYCWEVYLSMIPNHCCKVATKAFARTQSLEVSKDAFIHHYARGNYF